MSLTILLIIINVIASIYAWGNTSRMNAWMMNPYAISRESQYYRFITSGFIHRDYIHLIFNMITLYYFGSLVESLFGYFFGGLGISYYIILYFASMVVADIPSYIKYRNYQGYNSLGASGAVSAVVFSSILFQPVSGICIYFAFCIPAFIFGLLYLIYSYYQGRRMADNVNHDAHFYGAIFGLVFSIVIYPAAIGNFIRQISDYSLF
jgi:membrane associated rhomboid family serine protease